MEAPGDVVQVGAPVPDAHERYDRDGFLLLPESILAVPPQRFVERLDALLAGEYDLGEAPTKVPKPAQIQSAKGLTNKAPQTLHMINAHRSDALFKSLATSPAMGKLVSDATGWDSVRLAEDQVWIKPPQAGPLTYHRDTTYFDFVPKEVCTVWITFDPLYDTAVGPLEYCVGSHRWGEGARRGSAGQFFSSDFRDMMLCCAEKETGSREVDLVTVAAEAGGGSLHNGRTWHGSGPNTTAATWRRGIGLHYIRGDARFKEGPLGKLWEPHRASPDELDLPDERFPLVHPPQQ